MSRIDRKIGNERAAAIDAGEILAALARETMASVKRRKDAVSCYLSASDGWREASAMLGGAFAPGQERLTSRKNP